MKDVRDNIEKAFVKQISNSSNHIDYSIKIDEYNNRSVRYNGFLLEYTHKPEKYILSYKSIVVELYKPDFEDLYFMATDRINQLQKVFKDSNVESDYQEILNML